MLERWSPQRARRWFWLGGAATLIVLAMIALTIWASAAGNATPKMYGTVLGGNPAPDFRLTNQFGAAVSLSEQRGKVVVLTFLYTHCPDACPLTAIWLRRIHGQLGSAAQDVTILAVSVDPEGDTRQAVYEFSERFEMLERWSYLVGTQAELEPVWRSYYIGVLPDPTHHSETMHNAPLYLIDREGRLRAVHTTGAETESIIDEVEHDIRALLAD